MNADNAWNDKSIQSALDKVLGKAATEPAFRELCLVSPAEAVKEATEKDLPPGFKLRFVDNERADLTVILPDMSQPETELSDEDLEVVAGGTSKPSRYRTIDPV